MNRVAEKSVIRPWDVEKIVWCWQRLCVCSHASQRHRLCSQTCFPWWWNLLCLWMKSSLKGRRVIWRPRLQTTGCWGVVFGWDSQKEVDTTWSNWCPQHLDFNMFQTELNPFPQAWTSSIVTMHLIVNYIHTYIHTYSKLLTKSRHSYSRDAPCHCFSLNSHCLSSGLWGQHPSWLFPHPQQSSSRCTSMTFLKIHLIMSSPPPPHPTELQYFLLVHRTL